MKVLVIGLGSMGTRRVRCLQTIGGVEINGFDLREDRRQRAEKEYGIKVLSDFDACKREKYDALVISVPPHIHMQYMEYAVANKLPFFVEASVVDNGMPELIAAIKKSGSLACPSCTMWYQPSIKQIARLIREGALGKVSNFSYHCGQYLPDWHPWEDINDYYVSNPPTGGGREIVPFELTWLNWIFGEVSFVSGFYDKTIGLNAPIDDTYAFAMRYKNGVLGAMVVDVVARNAVRRLVVNGDEGQILWDWSNHRVDLYRAQTDSWESFSEPVGHSQSGYNVNIVEEPYIEELATFLAAVRGETTYPNTMEEDYEILQCLNRVEASDKGRTNKW
jgi:predicted dehydrogenase